MSGNEEHGAPTTRRDTTTAATTRWHWRGGPHSETTARGPLLHPTKAARSPPSPPGPGLAGRVYFRVREARGLGLGLGLWVVVCWRRSGDASAEPRGVALLSVDAQLVVSALRASWSSEGKEGATATTSTTCTLCHSTLSSSPRSLARSFARDPSKQVTAAMDASEACAHAPDGSRQRRARTARRAERASGAAWRFPAGWTDWQFATCPPCFMLCTTLHNSADCSDLPAPWPSRGWCGDFAAFDLRLATRSGSRWPRVNNNNNALVSQQSRSLARSVNRPRDKQRVRAFVGEPSQPASQRPSRPAQLLLGGRSSINRAGSTCTHAHTPVVHTAVYEMCVHKSSQLPRYHAQVAVASR